MKKRTKKLMALLLAATLSGALFAGCGGNVEQNADGSSTEQPPAQTDGADETEGTEGTGGTERAEGEWDEDPAEVTWMMWNVGGNANEEGIQKVEDALNEITLSKINVKVDLQILDMGTYLTQMPMQVSAGDKIDLVTTFPAGAGSFSSMLAAGQLKPLDDLMAEYGQETMALIPKIVTNTTSADGSLYALPVLTDYTSDVYFKVRTSLLEEAGMTADDVKTVDDITTVFEKIYAKHPDMKMISSGAQNIALGDTPVDNLGTELLCVMVDKDPTKVVSYFETDEYKEVLARMQGWYQAGYVDKDIATRTDDPTSDITVACGIIGGNLLRVIGGDALAPEPNTTIKMADAYISTSLVSILTMAIPSTATEPEAAAKLMNLCYTDKDVKMLVSYGIEGENYTYAENGGLEVNADSNYAPNTVGLFGNVLLCDSTRQELDAGYKMSEVDIDGLKYSPLLGFRINTDAISSEVAALNTVYEEYKGQILTGLADDASYQAFIDKLYANGLQTYIEEVQRQLDEWRAQQ